MARAPVSEKKLRKGERKEEKHYRVCGVFTELTIIATGTKGAAGTM